MTGEHVDLDALIGSWRSAFEAASGALRSAARDNDLSPEEVRTRSRHLSDERVATMEVLGALARDRHRRPLLVRLVASPLEAKRLLGLPADTEACIFNVDGVLVASAAIHADAWKETFDGFISRRIDETGGTFASFSRRVDYRALVHGRSRIGAVREFLASRGISLPEGTPTDEPGIETVHGLANRKNQVLLRRLDLHGVSAYDGSRLYLALAHDARLRCGVVTGSTNASTLLERAGLTALIDDCVDGNAAAAEGLLRKPSPDMLLAACRHLGVVPGRTAVFETTLDGVVAGRSGGFEFVVGVDQEGGAKALREGGADLVVADLGEILEHALAPQPR